MTIDPMLGRSLLAALSALVIGLTLSPLVIAWARKVGLVTQPRGDRWSRKPTAHVGGLAIVAATALSAWALLPEPASVLGPAGAAALIFAAGLFDDIRNLRPQYKLIAQVLAACIVVASGYSLVLSQSFVVNLGVTLLFIVGITNAMNLLDNMDGLAAGVALVSASVLALGAFFAGNASAAIIAGALAGACLAFLVFNSPPARVFMGDCGSMFLGVVLAVLAVDTSNSATTSVGGAILLPSIALAIPIFDTTFVTVMRAVNGRAISQGGCDHTSHRLVKLGLSEAQAVVLLATSSLLVGVLGIIVTRYHTPSLLLVGVLAAALLLVFGIFLARANVYPPRKASAVRNAAGVTLVVERLYKRHSATVLVDALLALAAALIVDLLYDGSVQSARLARASAIGALAAGPLALALCGVYRGVWHHLRAGDIARLTVGCTMAALGVFAGGMAVGAGAISSALAALFFAATFAMLLFGVRLFYRSMARAIAAARSSSRRRAFRWVVVAPAGASEEALRELITSSGQMAPPCGVIMPGPRAQRMVAGLPHLGAPEDMDDLIASIEPSAVLAGAPENRSQIEELCRNRGVTFLIPRDGKGEAA